MKNLLFILFFPIICYSQKITYDKNVIGEIEIAEVLTEINSNIIQSAELDSIADRYLVKWITLLLSNNNNPDFEYPAGYMVMCNMWYWNDKDDMPIEDLIFRYSNKTLILRNVIGDDVFGNIRGSMRMGISMRTMRKKNAEPLNIYMLVCGM